MVNRTLRFTLGVLAALSLAGMYGGWASVSVDELPGYSVAGQPFNLSFVVRQHGFSPMNNVSPRVEARLRGAEDVDVPGIRGDGPGRYAARLILPRAGEWTITIHSGWGTSRLRLLPLTVIERGAAAPRAMSDAERGRRLFAAKGCVTCHVHRDVEGSGDIAVGPDLTGKHYAPEYLQRWLADPAAVKGKDVRMPNLELKGPEIAALTAFINGEQIGSRSRD